MRQKVKVKALKYAVLDKEKGTIDIFRFKTTVANRLGVSTRTLDRQIPYENKQFCVYKVENVVSTP